VAPTAIAQAPDGTLVVGKPAREIAMRQPERGCMDLLARFIANQPVVLNGQTYTAGTLFTHLLSRLKADVEFRLHEGIMRACIAMPPDTPLPCLQQVREAGQEVGWALEPIPAPLAAVANLPASLRSAETILVYDLGGSTFTASVVTNRMGFPQVAATQTLSGMGGTHFDRLIADYVCARVQQEHGVDPRANSLFMTELLSQSERAKIILGVQSVGEIVIVGGLRIPTGALEDVVEEIDRDEFERLIAESVQATIDAAKSLLAGRAPDVVLPVGGSALAPAVRAALAAAFGREKLFSDVQSAELVAYGACLLMTDQAETQRLWDASALPTPAPSSEPSDAAPPVMDEILEPILAPVEYRPHINDGAAEAAVSPPNVAVDYSVEDDRTYYEEERGMEPPELTPAEPFAMPASDANLSEGIDSDGIDSDSIDSEGLEGAEPIHEQQVITPPVPEPIVEQPAAAQASEPEPYPLSSPASERADEKGADETSTDEMRTDETSVDETSADENESEQPVPDVAPCPEQLRLGWTDEPEIHYRRIFTTPAFVRFHADVPLLSTLTSEQEGGIDQTHFYLSDPVPQTIRITIHLPNAEPGGVQAWSDVHLPEELAVGTRVEAVLNVDASTGTPLVALYGVDHQGQTAFRILCDQWTLVVPSPVTEEPSPLESALSEETTEPLPSSDALSPPLEPSELAVVTQEAMPVAFETATTAQGVDCYGAYPALELQETTSAHRSFLTRHPQTLAPLLLKVFDRTSDHSRRLFQNSMASLDVNHRNILQLVDFGQAASSLYIVTEYCESGTLRDVMGPTLGTPNLDLETTLELTRQLCDGLDELHRHGIFHRNIKPNNLVVDVDQMTVKIKDFEHATILRSREVVTDVAGTLTYMAREVLERHSDYRADIYSVGVILYELLTGKLPFWAANQRLLVDQIMGQQPVAPRSLNPQISEHLNAVVLCALEKDVSRRFQTAAELRDALSNTSDLADLTVSRSPGV
jgi:hypothetical protein